MSVEKRIGKRGVRWVAIVEHPRDPLTKKRVQRKRTFATRKQADQWEREARAKIARGIFHEPSTEPFATHAAHWLESADLAESTRREYAGVIRRVVNPQLGSIPLNRLTGRHVQDLYNEVCESSNRLVVQAIVRGTLKMAVREEQVPRNVAEGLTVGRGTREKPVSPPVWEPEQLDTFLSAMRGHSLSTLFWTAAYTGMRLSELVNLKWDDVDLEGARLFVGKSKTPAGRRRISIDAETVDHLRQYQQDQAERQAFFGRDWEGDGNVFDRGNGLPVVPHTVEYVMKQAVTRLGLPPLTPHGLRHTHATTTLQAGVPVHVVQRRLGHASSRTTLDVYAHAMPADDVSVAEAFARAMRAPKSVNGDQTVTKPEGDTEETASE